MVLSGKWVVGENFSRERERDVWDVRNPNYGLSMEEVQRFSGLQLILADRGYLRRGMNIVGGAEKQVGQCSNMESSTLPKIYL